MIKKRSFVKNLVLEMKEWIAQGLITPEQQEAILARYMDRDAAPQAAQKVVRGETKPEGASKERSISFVGVLTGLATLCLAAGIILFYAANWRGMPPPLKLVQVFVLIFAVYGGALFFLDPKRRRPLIGLAMLILGIISYGAGIFLVAQIYHISSHPANGMLAWAAGALLMSLVAREKYACYLSAALFFIWNLWEIAFYGAAGFAFIIPVGIITVFLFWIDDIKGMILGAGLIGWYIFQISVYWIFHYAESGLSACFFILIFVTIGSIFHWLSGLQSGEKNFSYISMVLALCGWGMWALPFILLSHVTDGSGTPLFLGYPAFAWGLFLLAASFVIKKYAGYYAASAVFFLWSFAEYAAGHSAWLYILAIVFTAYFFYRISDKRGITLSACGVIWFLFSITSYFMDFNSSESYVLFFLLLMPAGALLIGSGRLLRLSGITSKGGKVLQVSGWVFFLVPFLLLSWPFDISGFSAVFMFANVTASVEYLVLLAAAGGLFWLFHKKNQPIALGLLPIVVSALVFFLPMGSTMLRMIVFHLGIVAVIIAMLYFAHLFFEEYKLEKNAGKVFFIAVLLVKVIGFLLYSGIQYEFHLAYLSSAILFIVVCFLLNRLIDFLTNDKSNYAKGMDALSAFCLWFAVYLSSFKVTGQSSIFEAGIIMITLSVLFLGIAAILYVLLFKRLKSGRLVIILSLIVLSFSMLTILIAGPSIPWQLYSVIFNFLLLAISITYIYYSTVIQSKMLLNIVIAGFILHIFTRYFDLFWDMFSGSLFFIITGFLGFFGGYLIEKNRKIFLRKIENLSDKKKGQIANEQ